MSSKQIGFVRQQGRQILQQLVASARTRVGSLGSCGGHALIYLFIITHRSGVVQKKGNLVYKGFIKIKGVLFTLRVVAMVFIYYLHPN
jgi:hypothetical protein